MEVRRNRSIACTLTILHKAQFEIIMTVLLSIELLKNYCDHNKDDDIENEDDDDDNKHDNDNNNDNGSDNDWGKKIMIIITININNVYY